MGSKTLLLALAITLVASSQALERRGRSLLSISSPLQGYEQNVLIQVEAPASPGASSTCILSGAPTANGLSNATSGPLFLDIAQGTGNHLVNFVYDASSYQLAGSIQPGNSKLLIDYSIPNYPQYAIQSSQSSNNDQGLGTIFLYSTPGNQLLCSAQIQFTIYGGFSCGFPNGGGGGGGGGGTVVVPSGPVYIYPSYPTTVVNQYTTVYNVQVTNNINVVSCTCCYNSCNTYVNQTFINPAAPPVPLNCTATPTAAGCVKHPPIPSPPVPPTKGPTASPPTGVPPTGTPPTGTPPRAGPPTGTPPTGTPPRASPPTGASPPTSGTPPPTTSTPPRASPPTGGSPPANTNSQGSQPPRASSPVAASG